MKYAILVALALSPIFAQADVKGSVKSEINAIDRMVQACLDNEDNQSTAGINMCYSDAIDAADKVLNRVYNNIKNSQGRDENSKEVVRRLVNAQRAWINFRDAEVELSGSGFIGGTAEGNVRSGKLFEMTKKRVLELEQLGL